MTQVLTSTFAPALSSSSKVNELAISVAYPFNLTPAQPQASFEFDTLSVELNFVHQPAPQPAIPQTAIPQTTIFNERKKDTDKNRGIMQRLMSIYRGKNAPASTQTQKYSSPSLPLVKSTVVKSTVVQSTVSNQRPRSTASATSQSTHKSTKSTPIVVAPCSEAAIFYL